MDTRYFIRFDKDFCKKFNIIRQFKIVDKEELVKLRTEPYILPVIYGSMCEDEIFNFDDIAEFHEVNSEEITLLERLNIV